MLVHGLDTTWISCYGQKESEMLSSQILLILDNFNCITLIAVRLAPHLPYRPFLRGEYSKLSKQFSVSTKTTFFLTFWANLTVTCSQVDNSCWNLAKLDKPPMPCHAAQRKTPQHFSVGKVLGRHGRHGCHGFSFRKNNRLLFVK